MGRSLNKDDARTRREAIRVYSTVAYILLYTYVTYTAGVSNVLMLCDVMFLVCYSRLCWFLLWFLACLSPGTHI